MKKLVVAENNALVRIGLKYLLRETGEFDPIAECQGIEKLLQVLEKDSFDLLLLDDQLQDTDSFEDLNKIRKKYPDLPVIIFTLNKEDNFMIKMFRKGAAALIYKDSPPEKIFNILRNVLVKRRYLTDEQAEKIANIAIDGDALSNGLNYLSPREYQIFKEISSGSSYYEIATKLKLSKNTIANHRMNILKKLSLRNNSDLTSFAWKAGIIH